MAKTVGLPLGITAKLILQNKIRLKGLHIPIVKEIYEPVLEELAGEGIRFQEEVS
jgi:saccharopine dehydrogenase (NADP+, L-glutamate forming)